MKIQDMSIEKIRKELYFLCENTSYKERYQDFIDELMEDYRNLRDATGRD